MNRGSYGITFKLCMIILQYMLLERGLFYLFGLDTRNVFILANCSMGILKEKIILKKFWLSGRFVTNINSQCGESGVCSCLNNVF